MAESPFGQRVRSNTRPPQRTDAAPQEGAKAPGSPPTTDTAAKSAFTRQRSQTQVESSPRAPSAPRGQQPDATTPNKSFGGGAQRSTGAPPAAKPPRLSPDQALLLTSACRAVLSARNYVQRRAIEDAKCIQFEYRSYLQRALPPSRLASIRRQRALNKGHYEVALSNIMDAVRATGNAIVAQESAARVQVWRQGLTIIRDALLAEETGARERLELVEHAEFTVAAQEAPRMLVSGTLDHDEFSERDHIARLRRSELATLKQQLLAMTALAYRRDLANGQEAIAIEELAERLDIVAEARASYADARLATVVRVESDLRETYDGQRTLYVSSLAQRRAITVRAILAAGVAVPEAEPRHRAAVMAAEATERRTCFHQHWDEKVVIRSREIEEDEWIARRGTYGLVNQERKERALIRSAICGLHLQLLQTDDITDVGCETGARTAIQWAERRDRYAMERSIGATLLALMLPHEEEAARRLVVQREAAARADILFAVPTRSFLAASENGMRRGIFLEWRTGTVRLLVDYALVHCLASEETERRHLLRQMQTEMLHLEGAEYLRYVEIKDRAMLVSSRRRLEQRQALLQRVRASPPDGRDARHARAAHLDAASGGGSRDSSIARYL